MKAFIIVIVCCLQPALSTYLGYPRLHFYGQFRVDTDTINSVLYNYSSTDPDHNYDWNFNGTGRFEFYDVRVTAVMDESGRMLTNDSVVGQKIFGNGKISDLDVDIQPFSTLSGFKLGVQWGESFGDIAFQGNWTRSIIAQYTWPRLKCYNVTNNSSKIYQGSFNLGAQSTSVITGIQWGNRRDSVALKQLYTASNHSDLSVRISLNFDTQNYSRLVAKNFTLGHVLGVIGVPGPLDTLNVPAKRTMFPTTATPKNMTFEYDDLCYGQGYHIRSLKFGTWMFNAPFEVLKNEVVIDLSNSVPVNLSNSLREFGTLRLGTYRESDSCVLLLGNETGIPYSSDADLPITSGVYNIPVDPSLMSKVENSSLVLVQYLDSDQGPDKICGEGVFSNSSGHSAVILLREDELFVRPTGYYNDRLDRGATSEQTMLVTRYGKPAPGESVKLVRGKPRVFPPNGVVPSSWVATSDSQGRATFVFSLNDTIPAECHYNENSTDLQDLKCNDSVLPIDGQVYHFHFCIDKTGVNDSECPFPHITMVFLDVSSLTYDSKPTWVRDVGPIFKQYAQLTPLVKKILDIGNYKVVTRPENIQLLNITLRLDFEDPSHLPTTRNFSLVEREMIFRWLEDPRYDELGSGIIHPKPNVIGNTSRSFNPPRCQSEALLFSEHPHVKERHYFTIHTPEGTSGALADNKGRPLLGMLHGWDWACTRDNVAKQLQTAVQLEWATIPTYLTALYSIKDGHNTEISGLIQSVVMQEMLHMTLAANMLIAMNVTPLIDSKETTPNYPTKLPGGVLPGLEVNLTRLTMKQAYYTFMGIEVPEDTLVVKPLRHNNTIGAFYTEIEHCIEHLHQQGQEIFHNDTAHLQVKWPWTPSPDFGKVIVINDSMSAHKAIEQITVQGEGSLLDPNWQEGSGLAHFFKFEEIVCGNHLEKVGNLTYAYSGAEIPFEAKGVWPMRDNPTASDIPSGTNCYNASMIFHTTYRKLLAEIQQSFGGSPGNISTAVQTMFTLKGHAKTLMGTKFDPTDPADDTTCGPVWEYCWPHLECA